MLYARIDKGDKSLLDSSSGLVVGTRMTAAETLIT